MAQYVEHVEKIPKAIDYVDVDSEKWAQYAQHAGFPINMVYRLESRRLRKYEAMLAKTYQYGFFVSQQEVRDFQTLVHPCSTLRAIPNGVDQDFFRPLPEPYDPNSLVFTGSMDYFANVETVLYFSEKIFPIVQREIPEATFYVVGSHPSEDIQKLGKQHANIVVTGFVDRVQPYMAKAAVFVAPMRIARGIQNKILEAMAMGLPVVTTSLGFEGIDAVPGKDLFVYDEPKEFAAQIIQLMRDSQLRRKVATNARNTIIGNYHWDKNLEQLENILTELAAPNP
jgi:sugar transferase (PEP-CTERM/EpsH1 system associated)